MPRTEIYHQSDKAPAKGGKWSVLIPHGKAFYRYELFDNGDAHVFKSTDGLNPTYKIVNGICTCPAAVHSKICKHVKSVQHSPTLSE